jgi:uroporphyrinogen decarboxylase
LDHKIPDRLPVATHDVMSSFLAQYQGGIGAQEFLRKYGFDPILMVNSLKAEQGQWMEIIDGRPMVVSDNWRISAKKVSPAEYETWRFTIATPGGNLTMVLQKNIHTAWICEHLVKEKRDFDLITRYAPWYGVNTEVINAAAKEYGDIGIVRGLVPCFEIYGQPGCWQDLACLFGIEKLIYEAYDDPQWVHSALAFLRDRKQHYIESLKGTAYDLIELGGGDASTTVISPAIFREFVAPYDSVLIDAARKVDQRIVYHTCGGMMPILEDIADMKPHAVETLTPPGMGGDVDLAEAKRRIGDRVCLIGGFDQGRYFTETTEQETREKVREAFKAAGSNGGFILSTSDHFFAARDDLLRAFVDEASKCVYG